MMFKGLCYRSLGRFSEARSQFELALSLNSNYTIALFNLGLVLQQLSQWDQAIITYHRLTSLPLPDRFDNSGSLSSEHELHLRSQIRECDLLQAQGRPQQASACWERASEMFPYSEVPPNELGNLRAQVLYTFVSIHSIFTFHRSTGRKL